MAYVIYGIQAGFSTSLEEEYGGKIWIKIFNLFYLFMLKKKRTNNDTYFNKYIQLFQIIKDWGLQYEKTRINKNKFAKTEYEMQNL